MQLTNKIDDLFSKTWIAYQKILDVDYMFHSQFNEAAARAIISTYPNKSISFLDIGCGDASPLAPVFKSVEISKYVGYDMSKKVLQLCEKQLAQQPFDSRLCCGTMDDLIENESEKFDVIYSGYAIHHLQDEEKEVLIKRIAEVLKPGGSFIYIDIDRLTGQSVEAYREAYSNAILQDWNHLDQEEKQHVIAHLDQFDFPAIKSTVLQWAMASGLEPVSEMHELRHLFVHFVKNQ